VVFVFENSSEKNGEHICAPKKGRYGQETRGEKADRCEAAQRMSGKIFDCTIFVTKMKPFRFPGCAIIKSSTAKRANTKKEVFVCDSLKLREKSRGEDL